MAIKCVVQKNPFMGSADVKAELPFLNASLRTIHRRLFSRLSAQISACSKEASAQRRKRLAFCRKYKNWTVQQWQNVMFSDELMFCQFGTHVHRVRRPSGRHYDEKYTVAAMKHPQKLMIWGCFSTTGRGSLYFIPAGKTVTDKIYLEILQSKLIQIMHVQKVGIFQQDGAPAHTANIVKNWFRDNSIQLLEWPGNSPNLNPIENLWELMKRRLAKKHRCKLLLGPGAQAPPLL